jgi:hypothetical protein
VNDLAIVIPVLRRPWRIAPVYESAIATVPEATVMFVASPDDQATLDALEAHDLDHAVADWPGGARGDYAKKINLGYRSTSEPYIFTGADDLRFHDGWYEHARAAMVDGINVVGTNDMCNPRVMSGAHSTHSLVRRSYANDGACVDQDHIVYCETYFHEYCDDELVATAMARACWAFAEDALVEHLHPNVHKSEMDETYVHGRAHTRESRRVFLYRRRLWRT